MTGLARAADREYGPQQNVMSLRQCRSLLCEARNPAVCVAALGFVLGCSGLARAQTVGDEKPRRVSLSYFGESAVQPGARLAYEGTPWARGVNQLLMGASIGGYSAAPGYGLFIFLEGGYRLALPTGLFFDLHVGIGYNAINRPATSVVTADGGTIEMAPTVGNYFMPIGMGGLGFDFQPRMKAPISLFVRGGGYGLAGQGEPFKGSYLLDAGLAYQFGTGKPPTVVSPVASPPPAEAPANLDGPGDPNRVPLIIPPSSPIAPTVPTSTLPPPLPPGTEGLAPAVPALPPPPAVPALPPS